MSLGQVNRGYNILGQGGAATAARMAPIPEPPSAPEAVVFEPKLEIAWGDFHQGVSSNIRSLFSWPLVPKNLLGADYFKECWIERRIPWRAVAAAALWHVVFVLSPFSIFSTTVRHESAFDNAQLTWSGPIEDFPKVEIAVAKPKLAPLAKAAKAIAPKGAEAFHPRQRIITDPVHPNHPRQTLINPVAPKLAPKNLPNLPNIVQLQAVAAPPRPHLQISAEALAKLHPRQHRMATVKATPLPDVPAFEQKPADITLSASPNAPARPKLDLNAGAAPRVAQRRQTGDTVPAPELAAAQAAATSGSPATLIALSAAPAPPKPDIHPPQGNLAARISMSPEGKKSRVPGSSPDESASAAGGGRSSVGISISGGSPKPKATVSGVGGSQLKLILPSSRDLAARRQSDGNSESAAASAGPPNFAILPPGAKPEQIFADRRVFTLNVQMANLNSASGSWILHFSELEDHQDGPRTGSSDLTGLAPIRKVDPKYPSDLIDQNVEGEVILYAVIRADGSVDSIQIVRSVDPQLDANAKSAFSQWKFRPAMKGGVAVALEAIVHVPFHISDNR